ncbi:MAG TPA: RNA methyltransferase [Syntrophothermus lipocalidus]|nr:RNA methyltransferase [Syntrophothermus lipocalidus]
MDMITSRRNALIKYASRLLERKARDREGKFLVEGVRMVREAMKRPELIEYVLVACDVTGEMEEEFWRDAASVYRIRPELVKEITDTENPSGIVAVCRKPVWDWESIPESDGLILIVDNLRDPGNLGTILRTAWAAGVDAVFLLKGTVDMYNPKVIRSSMGAVFHFPVFERVGNDEVRELCHRGYRLVVADSKASLVFTDADYYGNVAVVIGGETAGISAVFEELPASRVRIPLREGVDSLNAAVACGIILYEAWSQRHLVRENTSMI